MHAIGAASSEPCIQILCNRTLRHVNRSGKLQIHHLHSGRYVQEASPCRGGFETLLPYTVRCLPQFGVNPGKLGQTASVSDGEADLSLRTFLVAVIAFVAMTLVCACGTGPVDPAHAQTASDRDAVAALYNVTDGPNWTNNTNRLSDKSIGHWYGVTADVHGRFLELDRFTNQLTGQMPSELNNLSNLTRLDLSWNQLSGSIPPELGSLSNLTYLSLGANQLSEEIAVVLTADGDPLLYNDNVFVLPVAGKRWANEDLLPGSTNVNLRFYEYFRDDFDFLIFISNLSLLDVESDLAGAQYQGIMNDVEGIGIDIYVDPYYRGWGSAGALQGTIRVVTLEALDADVLLHELIHRWANYITSFGESEIGSYFGHWGFSSANGLLGGFDIADFVDHGDGRYSAGSFSPFGTTSRKPYSPIELYLAGFIPPGEVPDLWVAEDGAWLDEYTYDEHRLFTASNARTYTAEDIIAQHGPRIPDHTQAQRDLRVAAILLINEDHPLHKWQLEKVSGFIARFSHVGTDEFDEYNFYEATGGRATITMGGLSQSLEDTGPASLPGAPVGLTATGNALSGLELAWSEPASHGGLTVTAYDLRYIETSADETADSNWTVVEDVWTIVDGALQYTPSGLTAGTQYDLQVRAVNGLGAGPWSSTAAGMPLPTPTPTATPTFTPTMTPTPTATPTFTPTFTPTMTPMPTATPTPTFTPTMTPMPTATPTPTPLPTSTAAPEPTPVPIALAEAQVPTPTAAAPATASEEEVSGGGCGLPTGRTSAPSAAADLALLAAPLALAAALRRRRDA